jgi:MoaA/NifB/PqqE/SkfB family radical SAM enzyme
VKRRPSLRFHGNKNDELAGYDLHPCRFEYDQITLAIPNPVTFAIMKITAAQEQWERWENPGQDPRYGKKENREKAIKHAEDVFRVIAMVTREEADRSEEILEAIRSSKAYEKAADAAKASFIELGPWGAEAARERWNPEDFERMRAILREWFN